VPKATSAADAIANSSTRASLRVYEKPVSRSAIDWLFGSVLGGFFG
jgi:hypothetical protein